MSHVNTQIRDAAKARIAEVESLAQQSGESGKPLQDVVLPHAVVKTSEAAVGRDAKASKDDGPRELRTVELSVILVLAENVSEGLDDLKDELEVEVYRAIQADDTLGIGALRVQFMGHRDDVLGDEDGDLWYAVRVLTWMVDVRTIVGDPETIV